MNRISILFFGAVAAEVGLKEIELNMQGGSVAGTVIDRLSQKYPRLANHKLLVSVNEEYANRDTVLNDGDQVAIFTAVSGG